MIRFAAVALLVTAASAEASPESSQWQPVQLDGANVSDGADAGGDVDIVGDDENAALRWYADGATVWLQIRVSESTFQSGELVGAGVRQGGAARVFYYDGVTAQVGDWDVPCAGSEASISPIREISAMTSESDGVLTIELEVSQPDFIGDFSVIDELEILGFHGAFVGTSWSFDFAGVDEAAATWSCENTWSDAIVFDADEDGLPVPAERWSGADPLDADSDDDGLLDGEENLVDTDGDLLLSVLDCDSDGDNLLDGTEAGIFEPHDDTDESLGCFRADADPTTQTDPENADTDGGGLADGLEDWNLNGSMLDELGVEEFEVDPLNAEDDGDRDEDGIADVLDGLEEDSDDDDYKNYKDEDSDDDTIPDAIEFLYDTDGDGDRDYVDTDSDDDGLSDKYEGMGDVDGDGIANFRDLDTDGDGKPDEEERIGSISGDADCDGIADFRDSDDHDSDGDGEPDCGDAAPPVNEDDFDADNWDKNTRYNDGVFGGGGCATTSIPPKGVFMALGVLILVSTRRSRRLVLPMLAALLFSSQSSVAQSNAVNAARHVVSTGTGGWVRLEGAELRDSGTMNLGLFTDYSRNPYTFRPANAEEKPIALVGNVVTSQLNAGFTLGRFALGGTVPLHGYLNGALSSSTVTMGDIDVTMGVGLIRSQKFDLALWGGARLPSGERSVGLGAGLTRARARLAAGGQLGPIRLLGNVGFISGTGAQIGALTVGPAVTWGLGGKLQPVRWLDLGAELDGEFWFGNKWVGDSAQPGAIPVEWSVFASLLPVDSLAVSLSLGSRVGVGLGTPDIRGIMGVQWTPRLYTPKFNPARVDSDNDGVVDLLDRCVDQPEDINGIRDTDGCPDGGGLVAVQFEVVDVGGRLVAGAKLDLLSGAATGAWLAADGMVGRSLQPGSYSIQVNAEGFLPLTTEVLIPNKEIHGVRFTLVAPQEQGRVVLRLSDPQGKPVSDALVRVIGADTSARSGADGLIDFLLPPGAYEITVAAPGREVVHRPLTLDPGGNVDASILLQGTGERVGNEASPAQLNMKVFFAEGQSSLSVEALAILDELIKYLNQQEAIRKVRIEGHSDSWGEAKNAQRLSDVRAKTVGDYLVKFGINPDRLVIKGYGFNLPLQLGSSETVRGTNRRVEFHILNYRE